MAEAEKKPAEKKKAKPRRVMTTRHDDGSFSHEHHHDGDPHPKFAGTSKTLEDLQQHMADHFGGGAEPAAEGAPEAAAAGGGGEPEAGAE